MAGRIADDDKLLAGELLHPGLNTCALGAEVTGTEPPIRPGGGWPFGKREMEWTRKEPQTNQNQADCYFQARNCGANGFAAGAPNARCRMACKPMA
jgi:hypothetical protein